MQSKVYKWTNHHLEFWKLKHKVKIPTYVSSPRYAELFADDWYSVNSSIETKFPLAKRRSDQNYDFLFTKNSMRTKMISCLILFSGYFTSVSLMCCSQAFIRCITSSGRAPSIRIPMSSASYGLAYLSSCSDLCRFTISWNDLKRSLWNG